MTMQEWRKARSLNKCWTETQEAGGRDDPLQRIDKGRLRRDLVTTCADILMAINSKQAETIVSRATYRTNATAVSVGGNTVAKPCGSTLR
jgi:hypothetical protein